jgi:hypothetical protein
LGCKFEERAVGFSCCILRNWEIIEVEDSPYRVAAGPHRNGYLANIRVSHESAQVNFDDNVRLGRRELGNQLMGPGWKKTTASRPLRAWRTAVGSRSPSRPANGWHAHYRFPGLGNVKFVVSASAASSQANSAAEMADAAVKTLMIR